MPAYHARISLVAHNTLSGALIVNVLHAEVDTLTSPPSWSSIATDVNTWLGQEWKNVLSDVDTFDQIVVTDENYPGSTHGQGVHPVGAVGARLPTDHKLAPAICILCAWKTDVAKRYARGHTFLPPAYNSTETATGGAFSQTGAYWLAAAAFINKYKAGFTAGSTGYAPEVFSRHQINTGATPFSFPIRVGNLDARQRFLRSRDTTP